MSWVETEPIFKHWTEAGQAPGCKTCGHRYCSDSEPSSMFLDGIWNCRKGHSLYANTDCGDWHPITTLTNIRDVVTAPAFWVFIAISGIVALMIWASLFA
ncbi:MAG: hypothetical protein ACYS30_19655 [Planctomycetota bacterium]|jgi:hypothetical protein